MFCKHTTAVTKIKKINLKFIFYHPSSLNRSELLTEEIPGGFIASDIKEKPLGNQNHTFQIYFTLFQLEMIFSKRDHTVFNLK
jgi:hypothetical protein